MQETVRPIDEMPPLLAHYERNPKAGVPLLIGPVGCGKTQVVRQVMEEAGRIVCTRILSGMSVEDIAMAGPSGVPGDNFINFLANAGFPFVGTEARWLHPITGKPPCLFLDEYNRSIQYIRNLFLQVLTERSVHGIPLIPGTVMVAAGNAVDTGVQKLGQAESNRFVWYYTGPPSLDGFERYCIRHNVNEFIPHYHKQTGGERLYVHDADKALVEPAEPSPRVWAEQVGPVLDANYPDDIRMTHVAGAIGYGQANDFELEYRSRTHMPNLDAILAGHDQPVPKNVSVKILTLNALVRRSTHPNVHHVFNYISKLASNDPEYCDIFEKNLFIKDPTFAGNPAYTKWVLANNRKPILNSAAQPAAPQPVTPPPTAAPQPAAAAPVAPQPATPSIQDILKSIPTPKRRI